MVNLHYRLAQMLISASKRQENLSNVVLKLIVEGALKACAHTGPAGYIFHVAVVKKNL